MSGVVHTPWTPAVIAVFLELVNAPDKFGYREIAKRLTGKFGYTFTKNACIGKAGRLGLPPRPREPARLRKSRPSPFWLPAPIWRSTHHLGRTIAGFANRVRQQATL